MKGYLHGREENALHSVELTKLLLQYCGLLSTDDQHEEAFRQAQKGLNLLVDNLRILKVLCDEQITISRISTPTQK